MRISLSAHLLFLTLRGSDAPLTKDDIPHPIDTRQGGGYFYFKMIFGTVGRRQSHFVL